MYKPCYGSCELWLLWVQMNVGICPVKPFSLVAFTCMNHKKTDVSAVMVHPNCISSWETAICYWWSVEKICHRQHGGFIRGQDTKGHAVLQNISLNEKRVTEVSRCSEKDKLVGILMQTLCGLTNALVKKVLISPLIILGTLVSQVRKPAGETAGLLLLHVTLTFFYHKTPPPGSVTTFQWNKVPQMSCQTGREQLSNSILQQLIVFTGTSLIQNHRTLWVGKDPQRPSP